MTHIHKSITELIGNTPLLELGGYEKRENIPAVILAKLEYFNPTNSTKDRIAAKMIEAAEKEGKIIPGDTFAETTSGNTGISLAAQAAAKGYHFQAYIQDFVSKERKQIIKAYGAELINMSEIPEAQLALEQSGGDFVAATAAIKNKLASEHIFVIDQMHNPGNPLSHYETTGREIWRDTGHHVDILIACVGTGGTLTGTARYLKKKNKHIRIIAVEPRCDERDITGIHRFSDVDETHFPANLDRTTYDEVLTACVQDAYDAARKAAGDDGILVGVSSGAALWAADVVARRPENKGKVIVAIFPDTGLRYLSTPLFGE